MPSRKRQERIVLILDSLRSTGGASMKELAAALDVSEMTIRRDLELLSTEGRVRLVHAGAIPSDREPGDSSRGPSRGFFLSDARSPGAEEKMRIGQKAASLLEPGDVVIIDSGATTEWFTRSIPPDLPVTILCFALNIALEAGRYPSRSVVLAGGAVQAQPLVCQSPELPCGKGIPVSRGRQRVSRGHVHRQLGSRAEKGGRRRLTEPHPPR